MSKPFEEPSLDSLVSVLRADVVKVDDAARDRIHARLATGIMAQLFGSALLPTFLQNKLVKCSTFAKTKAFAVAVALSAGIAIGATGHAWYENQKAAHREPPAHGAAATRPQPVTESTPVVPAATSVSAPAALESATPDDTPVTPPRSAPGARDLSKALNHELSLLEQARSLLSEGKPQATLALLAQHQQRYPRSALEQERQALYIKALVAANRVAEARTRAAAFVRNYPNSTLRTSVEKSVLSIP